MPYSNIYLKYVEIRTDLTRENESDYSDGCDDRDGYDDDDDYGDSDAGQVIEFIPVKLTIDEPKGDFIELELDFEVNKDDVLHLIIVRYNSHHNGVFDDWCIESVHLNLEDAEEKAEAIEDLSARTECAEEKADDPVVLKTEVITLPLKKK